MCKFYQLGTDKELGGFTICFLEEIEVQTGKRLIHICDVLQQKVP